MPAPPLPAPHRFRAHLDLWNLLLVLLGVLLVLLLRPEFH